MTPDPSRLPAGPEVARQRGGGPGSQPATGGREEPAPALSGQIQNGIIPDIIQLISASSKTGTLTLTSKERKIELFMRDGDLCHATTEGMSGQAAFFAAIAQDHGSFSFEESEDLPEEITIDDDTQFLILEALRQIDENKRDT